MEMLVVGKLLKTAQAVIVLISEFRVALLVLCRTYSAEKAPGPVVHELKLRGVLRPLKKRNGNVTPKRNASTWETRWHNASC